MGVPTVRGAPVSATIPTRVANSTATPAPSDTSTLAPAVTPASTPRPAAAAKDATKPTGTLTMWPTPSPTYSPIRTCALSVSVFSDHNGNGQQDGGEPSLEGIGIRVGSPEIMHVVDCASDGNGICDLGYLPVGHYVLSVHDPSGAYGWITPSLGELLPISKGLRISLSRCQVIAVPLRQVPGTSPICGSPFVLLYGFDYNREIGVVRNRLGQERVLEEEEKSAKDLNVYDNHDGLDFSALPGTVVRAVVPGTAVVVPEGGLLGLWQIRIGFADGRYEFTQAHLHKPLVKNGQRVERYQPIGTVTDRFSSMIVNWSFADHIHLEFNAGSDGREDPLDYMAADGALHCPEGTARVLVYSPPMEGHYEAVMAGEWP